MACHLNIPLAVALIGGRALAPIPGLATVEPDPQLALVLFLSLLIQASAHQTIIGAPKSTSPEPSGSEVVGRTLDGSAEVAK
jgi:hypothetical protein